MKPECWRQVEEIFQEALQHDPGSRDAYVREACHGDAELQREVASLLANHQETTDFKPWAAAAAAQLIDGPTSLKTGQRLGPYEIIAPIGAGGMGEVYKARDTRLKRDVAIKICAAQFSERFEREARVIASLNHPNICQLHDVGPNFLVMELVEGENLSGPLPMATALNYASQIAEALGAAHEKGVVHRDLKPANVKITRAGVVKVLDFGLAKAVEEPSMSVDPTNSPTMTMSPTRAGVILGTAAYMSPEQARGAEVDKRADIWAFGCVLYEMVAGKQAFHGETTSDILAAVLKEEPDWSRIPEDVQPLIRRCLLKDPKQRLRDIRDAMPLFGAAPVPNATSVQRPWPWLVSFVLAGFAILGWWRATRSAPLRPLIRLSAELPPGTGINRFSGPQVALSPDGAQIAVGARRATGGYGLATLRLDQREFTTLPGGEGGGFPFFSPDGQWIGFVAGGKLKKISVHGGPPVTLCDMPSYRGASWGDDGNIVVGFRWRPAGLVRVPSGGGAPAVITEVSQKTGETAHGWPQVLPGSQAVLFTSFGSATDSDIDVFWFKTGQRKTVHHGGFFGRYLPVSKNSGYLVYMQRDTLFAEPFDLTRMAVTGARQPVIEDVANKSGFGFGIFDFSPTGTFIYASGKGEGIPETSIFWLDSAGQIQPLQPAPGEYRHLRFSPDGKRLAYETLTAPGQTEIWVKDLTRDVTSRLTSLAGENNGPIWTPDGVNVVFNSYNASAPGTYSIRADGSGEPQRLTEEQVGSNFRMPNSFSPDGKWLAFDQFTDPSHSEIWMAPLEGDRDRGIRLGRVEQFLKTPFLASSPVFSRDGRWLAYSSNETGTFEIYVRPFPGPGTKTPISTGGGRFPVWSRNGRELFFVAPDRRVMVAGYSAENQSFAAAKPRVWSERKIVVPPTFYPYDVSPNGKRLAVLLYSNGTSGQDQQSTDRVTVLLNFFDELRRRVPVGGQ